MGADDYPLRQFFLQGGYAQRIMTKWTGIFKQNPKWLIGFTILLSSILSPQHLGIETMHSIMPFNFPKARSGQRRLRNLYLVVLFNMIFLRILF